jgi:hypothetical protein
MYLFYFLAFDVVNSAPLSLLFGFSVLVALALFSYVIVKYVSKAKWNGGLLGLRKEGLERSFLLASVVSIIGPVIQLYVIRTSGIDSLVQALLTGPASLTQILRSLPASLFCFSVLGVLAFGFFQAFPYSLLEGYRLRW